MDEDSVLRLQQQCSMAYNADTLSFDLPDTDVSSELWAHSNT